MRERRLQRMLWAWARPNWSGESDGREPSTVSLVRWISVGW
jgi:hypothetical protein